MSVLMFGKRSAVTSGESGADRAALLYDTAQIAEPYVLGPSRCTADYHQSDCTRIMQFSCCILQVVLRSAADRHYQTWSEGPARGCVGAQQWGDDCTYVASCTRSTEYTPREMWQRTNCTCVPAVVFSLFLNKLFGLWRRSFRSFSDESRFENVSQIKLLWLFCLHFRSKKNNTTPFVSGDCLLSSYCGLMEVLLLFKNNALIPFTAHIFLHYPPVRIA